MLGSWFTLLLVFETPWVPETQCRAGRLAQDLAGLWLLAGCAGVPGGLHRSLAEVTQGP